MKLWQEKIAEYREDRDRLRQEVTTELSSICLQVEELNNSDLDKQVDAHAKKDSRSVECLIHRSRS